MSNWSGNTREKVRAVQSTLSLCSTRDTAACSRRDVSVYPIPSLPHDALFMYSPCFLQLLQTRSHQHSCWTQPHTGLLEPGVRTQELDHQSTVLCGLHRDSWHQAVLQQQLCYCSFTAPMYLSATTHPATVILPSTVILLRVAGVLVLVWLWVLFAIAFHFNFEEAMSLRLPETCDHPPASTS